METKNFEYYIIAFQTTDGRFYEGNYQFSDYQSAYDNANGLWNDEPSMKAHDIENIYIKKYTTQIEVVTQFV